MVENNKKQHTEVAYSFLFLFLFYNIFVSNKLHFIDFKSIWAILEILGYLVILEVSRYF